MIFQIGRSMPSRRFRSVWCGTADSIARSRAPCERVRGREDPSDILLSDSSWVKRLKMARARKGFFDAAE
eukprot:scaffold7052_cov254-Pinguiococcus_pyrenoidosus.AAC.105